MGSYFELVTPTNYKYGLIFKISELQNPELPLITKMCKYEDRTTEFISTSRDATYVCEERATNKKNYRGMGNKTKLLVNKISEQVLKDVA